MKAIHQQIQESSLVSRLQHMDPSEDRPADREVRRLRGLSAEVGKACNAWLSGRGIKGRTWGNHEPQKPKGTKLKLEFHYDA